MKKIPNDTKRYIIEKKGMKKKNWKKNKIDYMIYKIFGTKKLQIGTQKNREKILIENGKNFCQTTDDLCLAPTTSIIFCDYQIKLSDTKNKSGIKFTEKKIL